MVRMLIGLELSEGVELVRILVRRGVITTDPADADTCCGLNRDGDGFCTYRPSHPIYVKIALSSRELL